MADTVKAETTLKIDTLFVDGDTRTITLKNPRSNLSGNDISELNAFMQANNIIIGDKAGATFGRIQKAATVQKNTISLDIS